MKVAIVGLGVAGSGVLKELISHQNTRKISRIDVYEPNEKLGQGFPYQQDDEDVQMNSYAQDLSIVAKDEDDFLNWLQENYLEKNYTGSSFVPRSVFGHYLVSRLTPFLNDERINHYPRKAIDMKLLDADHKEAWSETDRPFQYIIQDEKGQWSDVVYDAVFFVFGHAPYADHYHLLGCENYIHNPYPIEMQLNELNSTMRIGLIGSGLTGLDIMYYLLKNNVWNTPITFYIRKQPFTTVKSRRYDGDIKLTISKNWLRQEKEKFAGQIPLEVIKEQIFSDLKDNHINWNSLLEKFGKGSISQVKNAVKEENAELERLQRYLGDLTPCLPDLNMTLNPIDREKFWKEYKGVFEHFRSQMPLNRIQLILDKIEAGQVKIVSGLETITHSENQFIIQTKKNESHRADLLINATGFEKRVSYASKMDTLIRQLYKREIISQDGTVDIQVSWPSCQLLTKRYGQLNSVYLLGNWIFHTQFGNNNAKLNHHQGQVSARHLMDSL